MDWEFCMTPLGLVDRGVFPPLERAKLVSFACTSPGESDRLLTRWSIRELASEHARYGLREPLSRSSVARFLDEAELSPHRVAYWMRSQDPEFEEKATSVLWYYERARTLAREGILVMCLDEKPGIQALGRVHPDIPPKPGSHPRLREFEYIRYGTVNLLAGLEVVTGKFWGGPLATTNRIDFIEQLERLDYDYSEWRRIELLLDNASAHTAKDTLDWFAERADRIRPHFTPTHASWLNQAELLLSGFSRRYLRRVVKSRDDLLAHIASSIQEYNAMYAKPFDWSFTRHAMHQWWEELLHGREN